MRKALCAVAVFCFEKANRHENLCCSIRNRGSQTRNRSVNCVSARDQPTCFSVFTALLLFIRWARGSSESVRAGGVYGAILYEAADSQGSLRLRKIGYGSVLLRKA